MGVLTPTWLLGPCPLLAQHPLQFGLGEQRQEWQLSLLPGDRQPLEIASELPFLASGGMDPSRGLYIHFVSRLPPPQCCMHIILYSQSIVLGPCLLLLGWGGGDWIRASLTGNSPRWICGGRNGGIEKKAVDNPQIPSVDLGRHLFYMHIF